MNKCVHPLTNTLLIKHHLLQVIIMLEGTFLLLHHLQLPNRFLQVLCQNSLVFGDIHDFTLSWLKKSSPLKYDADITMLHGGYGVLLFQALPWFHQTITHFATWFGMIYVSLRGIFLWERAAPCHGLDMILGFILYVTNSCDFNKGVLSFYIYC